MRTTRSTIGDRRMMLRRIVLQNILAAALVIGVAASASAQPEDLNKAAQKEVDAATVLMEKGDKASLEQAISKLDHAIELLGKKGNNSAAADAYFSRAMCKINVGQSSEDDLKKVVELSADNPSNRFL